MKKIVIALFMMVGLCSICFAEDAFLGWRCKDNVALKAAIVKDNKDVPVNFKVLYALMIAENENPSNVNTLAKCTQIVKNAYTAAGVDIESEDRIFTRILQFFFCRENKVILNEIIASPLSKDNIYFKINYIGYKNWVNCTSEEYKNTLFDILKYSVQTSKSKEFNEFFDLFLEASIEDKDEVVVKKLQILHRLALPKLAKDEKMKHMVVSISLALKGYGVEVK